jgi:hypothetical protein
LRAPMMANVIVAQVKGGRSRAFHGFRTKSFY